MLVGRYGWVSLGLKSLLGVCMVIYLDLKKCNSTEGIIVYFLTV